MLTSATVHFIKLDVLENNCKCFGGLLWCGQMKLLTSPAKNWWQPSPFPPREARAPGLALGKPPGYTTSPPFLLPRPCHAQTHHGTCFEPSCHWTLYQFGSINASARKLFAKLKVLNWIVLQCAFHFSRSVFSKRQGIFMARQLSILITQCMHGGTLWGKHESTVKTGNEKSLHLGYQIHGWLNGALVTMEVEILQYVACFYIKLYSTLVSTFLRSTL